VLYNIFTEQSYVLEMRAKTGYAPFFVPDRQVLKLSDAFMVPVKDGTFEWTATVLNINYGQNEKLHWSYSNVAFCVII
jgi:hypothetical protein